MKKLFLFIAIFFVGLVITGCEKTNAPTPPKVDKTPPTVLSGSPDENATDVSVKSKIIVTFSKKMDTFSAKDAFSTSPNVKGTVEWSNGDTVMNFTPDSELAPGTTYTCSIATNAADIDGNTLESQIQWNWTTAAAKTAAAKLPPSITFGAPPDLVVLPETDIYVVPGIQEDIFFISGWWWRNWNEHWYRSRWYDHGWGYYSGYPSWQTRLPRDWRHSYTNHMWGGRPWNPSYIHYNNLDEHWRGGHWRDNKGFGNRGPDTSGANKKGFGNRVPDTSGTNKKGFGNRGPDVSGANKQSSVNRGTNTSGTNKQSRVNRGTNMSGANKQGSVNRGTNTSGVNKQGSVNRGPDMSGANKQGSVNRGTNTSGVNKQGSVNRGPDMSGANKQGNFNRGTNTSGVNKQGSVDRSPDVSGANKKSNKGVPKSDGKNLDGSNRPGI